MYAIICTGPDIAHAVGVIVKSMSNLAKEHWEGVKWLLRYLKGTLDVALYLRREKIFLEGFANDLVSCVDL